MADDRQAAVLAASHRAALLVASIVCSWAGLTQEQIEALMMDATRCAAITPDNDAAARQVTTMLAPLLQRCAKPADQCNLVTTFARLASAHQRGDQAEIGRILDSVVVTHLPINALASRTLQ